MTGNVLNYYAGGNTARGFHNLYEENLKGLNRLFILKGGPGTGKSSLIKVIGREWVEKGYDIEFYTVLLIINRLMVSLSRS